MTLSACQISFGYGFEHSRRSSRVATADVPERPMIHFWCKMNMIGTSSSLSLDRIHMNALTARGRWSVLKPVVEQYYLPRLSITQTHAHQHCRNAPPDSFRSCTCSKHVLPWRMGQKVCLGVGPNPMIERVTGPALLTAFEATRSRGSIYAWLMKAFIRIQEIGSQALHFHMGKRGYLHREWSQGSQRSAYLRTTS